MDRFNSPIDILKLLDSSNCRKCDKPTCLAFAAAVFRGQSKLDECPKLERETIDQYGEFTSGYRSTEQPGNELIEGLKARITTTNLALAARRLGAEYNDGRLTIKCLGKDFGVDTEGNFITDIHVNPWITVPVLTYILDGAGTRPSGKWVTFRELDRGENIYPFFEQRCEIPLKKVADTYTRLFEDMLQIFAGRQVDYHYPADISFMLHPLPRVPLMICYTEPEDDLASSLAIFFDETVVDNLNLGCAFNLGVGLTTMFAKIALRHSNR